MKKAIELTNIVKNYGSQAALKGVSLTVEDGAFCVLLGPSGCGKSTLLRLLAGLEVPSSGHIQLAGTSVVNMMNGVWLPPGKRQLGMVFQSYALWPHKTARENIEWPLRIAGLKSGERTARLNEVSDMLSLGPYLDRYPSALSGGQQQRVAIARAIAPRPKLLLLDEPLSNLDAQLRVEMRSELLRLHRETGATIVHVTHDQMEAMTMATQIVVMNEGYIKQDDDVQKVISNPKTAFVAKFVGNPPANLVTLDGIGDGWTPADMCGLASAIDIGGRAVQVMIRPEHMQLHTEPAPKRRLFRVVEHLPFGTEYLLHLHGTAGRISVLTRQQELVRSGSVLYAQLPDKPDAVFDEKGERIA